ncbi:MAG: bifunctional ADP-heptose synthase [Bacteroidales bacterium]|nr:bifunctional ADP-heptose synthase [Bacteroidales bacterium]
MENDFLKVVNKFAKTNVIVIGDVMIDSYLWGSVTRISPEAPIPVVNTTKRELRLGGAANVALNIKSLGAKPILCSVIGNEAHGVDFKRLLFESELTDEGIVIDSERITTIKHRVISGSQHLLRVDEEDTKPLRQEISEKLFTKIARLVSKHNSGAIIFEDYDKGVITPWLIKNVVSLAKSEKIPILVDPKKRNFLEYKDVDVFKPNFKELCEGTNSVIAKNDFQGIFEADKKLRKILNHKFGFITLSENGVFLSDGTEYERFPSNIREVTDVSGAGDTVIATVSLCLAAGMDMISASKIANIAGGLVCERVGVVPVDINLLINRIKSL